MIVRHHISSSHVVNPQFTDLHGCSLDAGEALLPVDLLLVALLLIYTSHSRGAIV